MIAKTASIALLVSGSVLGLASFGQGAPRVDAAEPRGAESPAPYRAAMEAVLEAERGGDLGRARELLSALSFRVEGLPEARRAEVRFADGYLALRAELEEPTTVEAPVRAIDAFESARALAGPGSLRLAATYDAAVAELESAERHRLHIPEIGNQVQQSGGPTPLPLESEAAAANAPQSDPDAQPKQPDPLAETRAAYGRAKDLFVERLRADWRDTDTRANLEWIERRLVELDHIEQERKKQEEEKKDDDSKKQNQDGDKGDPKKSDESKQDGKQDPKDQDSPGDESKQDEEGDPEDPKREDGEDQKPGQEEGKDEKPPQPGEDDEAAEPQSGKPPEQGGEAQSGKPGDTQPARAEDEQHLTHEEVVRLLDQLGKIEEEGKQVQEALRRTRRVPVDRDW